MKIRWESKLYKKGDKVICEKPHPAWAIKPGEIFVVKDVKMCTWQEIPGNRQALYLNKDSKSGYDSLYFKLIS